MADLQQNFGAQLTDEVKTNIIDILDRYSEVWQTTRVACSKNFIYRIDTGNASPIVEPHRHFAPKTLEELKRLTRDLLQAGAVRRSNSNWLSQPVIVSKKDGSSRLCVDFRSLNAVTKADPFNAPDAAAVIRQLGHAKIFIVMDLKNSFNQMRIHPDDRCKTAFWTPLGQMEWLGVPFGLLNGTSALARWLYLNVIDLEGVAVYVDDIVIHADDETTLLKYFEAMMKRLAEIGAYINVTKCKFGVEEIEFLGFNIKGGRLTPPTESVKAINAIKLPYDTTTVRRFLGMVGYFRNFIKDFAKIAGPLYELLQKDVPFKMTDERIASFQELQKALTECPGLANPHHSWPYVLDTDASTTAIGACLMQLDEQKIGQSTNLKVSR
ncbi:putative reverse-transcriptase-like protein [Gregarina niphandrodes]|uniref:Reverse-transcriptase-like protein n=1 Tax=Gregarina niphandrodes TaxID=110365 RepID=A0A023AWZ7_GRENI|nr:putative reverse-transcriptase-like protein [Gregarina niphandrodes]EZG43107.1 putative reverse-transcriptase-like protein [Gregarina niphandrodes]|eukprot:XP_011133636.1 putative reverse-transcriptase-like protein [Gregarina niphandrodes]